MNFNNFYPTPFWNTKTLRHKQNLSETNSSLHLLRHKQIGEEQATIKNSNNYNESKVTRNWPELSKK